MVAWWHDGMYAISVITFLALPAGTGLSDERLAPGRSVVLVLVHNINGFLRGGRRAGGLRVGVRGGVGVWWAGVRRGMMSMVSMAGAGGSWREMAGDGGRWREMVEMAGDVFLALDELPDAIRGEHHATVLRCDLALDNLRLRMHAELRDRVITWHVAWGRSQVSQRHVALWCKSAERREW